MLTVKFGRCSSIAFLVLFLFVFTSEADTLILKNGRHINSMKCWEDGDLIKCKVHGQVIGYPKDQVVEIRKDSVPKSHNGFLFGVWQSGITVHEAIDIAEANNYPFVKNGIITSSKFFNPKSCRPYVDTDTRFEYKENLFNKLAHLRFSFTPTSKKLYTLEVVFSGTGIPKESEFQQQIEAMLREKYGNPFKVTDHILFKDYDWRISANATVTMRPISNSVIVTYSDVALSKLAETEKLNNIRAGVYEGG